MAEYGLIRRDQRRRMAEIKRNRRVEVGPYATFYFENYDTMWHQVHEMLFVEKGGEDQIQGELDAYNPLIPDGSELVATVMFEIADAKRRSAALNAIGGIENHMLLSVGGDIIRGAPDETRDNTSPEGKASSVQFVRFALTADQKHRIAATAEPVLLGFDHPHYGHLAMMPASVRQSVGADLCV
jgi:hypothetical protein